MVRALYITSFVVLILCASSVQAQYPIDALRFSFSNLGSGTRAMSMGGAYAGVADDFFATYWNPAGLGQVHRVEFTGGFDNVNVSNDATYLNAIQNYSNNVTNIGSIGIVLPVETWRGSLAFAIGYNRPQDFTSAVSAKGYNEISSVASAMYIDPTSIQGDMAYRLFLEDTLGNVRINNNVYQAATILEEGRLGSWAFAGSIEAAKDLFFGASIDLYSGTYSYNREIDETDPQGHYRNYQEGSYSGWHGLNLMSTLDQDISGIGAKLGILYRLPEIGPIGLTRIGLTLKTPSVLSVKETWTDRGTAFFDNGSPKDMVEGKTEYDIITPFQFSGGISMSVENLLLSGSAELTDWSQMKFDNSQDLNAESGSNKRIKELFRMTLNLRAGGEFTIPGTDLKLRGGYAVLPSPYKDDPSTYARRLLTCGVGYTIDNTFTLDVAYMREWHQNFEYLYGGNWSETRIDDNIKSNNVMVTLSYKF